MKIYVEKLQRLLPLMILTVGLMITAQAQSQTIPPANVALSSVIYKEKSGSVELTPTNLSQNVVWGFISGDGSPRVSGTLTTAGCARIKMQIRKTDNNVVFDEVTRTICGSQQISWNAKFLNYTQDDNSYSVRVDNIDSWNQTSISGNLTFRYPTADRLLTGQTPTKFDLSPGSEAEQQFILTPNLPGRLKVKVVYGNNAKVRVTLKKPKGAIARSSVDGTSGLEFIYDVTKADTTGDNVWAVNVLNPSLVQVTDVSIIVIFTLPDTYPG